MRCKACDVILEDYELRAKDNYGNYFDMCYNCISGGSLGLEEEDLGNITEETSYDDSVSYDTL